MRAPRLVIALALLAAASPAAAQLANRSISIESGVCLPLAARAGAGPVFGLSSTVWLDGAVEAVFRLGFASGAHPGGRAPATALAGTAGLRLSLLPDPVRPQLGIELGWARVGEEGGEQSGSRVAVGVSAGLEWFPARDLSVAARVALRAVGAVLSTETALAATAYF